MGHHRHCTTAITMYHTVQDRRTHWNAQVLVACGPSLFRRVRRLPWCWVFAGWLIALCVCIESGDRNSRRPPQRVSLSEVRCRGAFSFRSQHLSGTLPEPAAVSSTGLKSELAFAVPSREVTSDHGESSVEKIMVEIRTPELSRNIVTQSHMPCRQHRNHARSSRDS